MDDVAIIRNQANIGAPISPQEMERMAKRRFQDPKPQRRGAWWTMRVWRDEFVDGKHVRKQQRVRLAAATVPEREVKKIATEYLRPLALCVAREIRNVQTERGPIPDGGG